MVPGIRSLGEIIFHCLLLFCFEIGSGYAAMASLEFAVKNRLDLNFWRSSWLLSPGVIDLHHRARLLRPSSTLS